MVSNPVENTSIVLGAHMRQSLRLTSKYEDHFLNSSLSDTSQTFLSTVFPFTSSKFSQGENFVFILAQRNMAAVMKTLTPAMLI